MTKVKGLLQQVYKALFFRLLRPWLGTLWSHKLLFKPIRATINITENCNSKCITCRMWRQRSMDELTTEEVKEILCQLRGLGIRGVGFTGGEPTLRADLPEIIQHTSELGFKEIQVISNALVLDEQKAEALIKSGLTRIAISLDGIGETHDKVRGVEGSFSKTLNALETCAQLRDTKYTNLRILVMTTLMNINIDQIPQIFGICRDMNCQLSLNLPHNTILPFLNIDLQDLVKMDNRKLNLLIDELHKLKRKYPGTLELSHTCLEYTRRYFNDPKMADCPCCLGYFLIYIGAHGEVYSGCWALKTLGSLREQRLREIITQKVYRERLRNMFFKKCPGCACNAYANIGYDLSIIREESLWRMRLR